MNAIKMSEFWFEGLNKSNRAKELKRLNDFIITHDITRVYAFSKIKEVR